VPQRAGQGCRTAHHWELSCLAEKAITDAARVARNARRALARADTSTSGRLGRLVSDLDTTIQRTTRIVAQTRMRLAGQIPDGASRLVSLHHPDARPIVKGRIGRPVEFGSKAQVADNPDGVVPDYRSRLATRWMRRCWPRRWSGSRPGRAGFPGR
jgi:transposase, IS5 family